MGDTEIENAAMQVAYRINQFPVMVYGHAESAQYTYKPIERLACSSRLSFSSSFMVYDIINI